MSGSREREPRSVVIVDVNAASSVAAVRSLGERGVRPIVVSEEENAAAFSSKYCAEAVVTPSPSDDLEAYKDALLRLAARDDVATIAPFREADVYVLSKFQSEFEPHVATPWPSFDALRTVQDRLELLDAAEAVDVPVPATYRLDEFEDWSHELVVKSRYAVHVEDNRADYRPVEFVRAGQSPNETEITDQMGHVPIVQERISGTDEYSFLALYDHGEPVTTFQHRQVRGTNYAGGTSAFRVSIDDPDLEAQGRKLLDYLDWHGPADVEFKRDDERDEYKLVEINPRFWSSLPFHVRAGVDFPYYYWALATGEEVETDPAPEYGIGGHFLLGEAKHLLSILTDDIEFVRRPSLAGRSAEVLRSIAEHPRFDYLSADDPRPFGRAVLNNVDKLRTNR